MLIFLGFLVQLAASVLFILFGYATSTNLGGGGTNKVEKLIGVIIMSVGAYGLYDLSTMFNYIGVQ